MVRGRCLYAQLSKKQVLVVRTYFWKVWEQTNLERSNLVSTALISFCRSEVFTRSKTRLSLSCSEQKTCCDENILKPWGRGWECGNHIVKVGVDATCYHFKPWRILKETNDRRAHLESCHRNPDTLERVPNRIALYNSAARTCAPMQAV